MGGNSEVQGEIPRSASIDISGDRGVAFTFRTKDASTPEDPDFANFVSLLVQEINLHYQSYSDEVRKAQDPYYTARIPYGVEILHELVNSVSEGIKFTDTPSNDQLKFLDETITRYKIGRDLTLFQRFWPFSREGRRHPETQAFYEDVKSEILNLKNYNSIQTVMNDFTQELNRFANLLRSLKDQPDIIETHMNWGKSFAKITQELDRNKYRNAIDVLKPIIQTAEDYINEDLIQSKDRLQKFVSLIQSGMEKNLPLRAKTVMLSELGSYFSLFQKLESFKFYLYYYSAYERPADFPISTIKDLINDLEELENSIYSDAVIAEDGTSSTYTIWLRLQNKLNTNPKLKSDFSVELNAIENQLNKINDDYEFEMVMRKLYSSLYNTKFRSLIAPGLEEYIKLCQDILIIEFQQDVGKEPKKKRWSEMSRIEKGRALRKLVARDEKRNQQFFTSELVSRTSSMPQSKMSREELVRENFVRPYQKWGKERVSKILHQIAKR